jgi:hypothetical protein
MSIPDATLYSFLVVSGWPIVVVVDLASDYLDLLR